MPYRRAGPSEMNYPESTTTLDLVAMRYKLRMVGELYDFLCEMGFSNLADYL